MILAGHDFDKLKRLVDAYAGDVLEPLGNGRDIYKSFLARSTGPGFVHTDVSSLLGLNKPQYVSHRADAVAVIEELVARSTEVVHAERRVEPESQLIVRCEPWTGERWLQMAVGSPKYPNPTTSY